MAQLSDDCFAGGDALIPAQAALDLILPRLVRVTAEESLPLADCLDRILAVDVVAAIDVPGDDNSAVDGYAVYFADLDPAAETRLPIGGRAAAGHPLGRAQRRGEAVRIFTGAPMPTGEAGLWIAALLTLVTGYDYLQTGLRHMAADPPDGAA